MAMIYLSEAASQKLREIARRDKRTPGKTVEVMIESAEHQHRSSGQAENKLFNTPKGSGTV